VLDESVSLVTFACLVVAAIRLIALLSANNNAITTFALTIQALLGIPAIHATAALASQSTKSTLLCLTKLSAEAGLIDTSVVSTGNSIGNLAVRKIVITDTEDFVLVAEGTVVSIITKSAGAIVQDIAVEAGCAGLARTFVTALETKISLADILGASGLLISNEVIKETIGQRKVLIKDAVPADLKSKSGFRIVESLHFNSERDNKVGFKEQCGRSEVAHIDGSERVLVEVQELDLGHFSKDIIRKRSETVVVESEVNDAWVVDKQILRDGSQRVGVKSEDLETLKITESINRKLSEVVGMKLKASQTRILGESVRSKLCITVVMGKKDGHAGESGKGVRRKSVERIGADVHAIEHCEMIKQPIRKRSDAVVVKVQVPDLGEVVKDTRGKGMKGVGEEVDDEEIVELIENTCLKLFKAVLHEVQRQKVCKTIESALLDNGDFVVADFQRNQTREAGESTNTQVSKTHVCKVQGNDGGVIESDVFEIAAPGGLVRNNNRLSGMVLATLGKSALLVHTTKGLEGMTQCFSVVCDNRHSQSKGNDCENSENSCSFGREHVRKREKKKKRKKKRK